MKPTIIGLSGKAGSGKDTAGQFIKEQLQAAGRRVTVESFAKPIRQMLLAVGVPAQYMVERSLKEAPIPGFNGASYRMLAQTLGTEWGRHCLGRNFWIAQLEHRLSVAAEVQPTPEFLILTDVRMLNEAQWVKGQGGLIVRIARAGAASVRQHESEGGVFDCDHVLRNESTLPDLRAGCAELATLLLAMRSLAQHREPAKAA